LPYSGIRKGYHPAGLVQCGADADVQQAGKRWLRFPPEARPLKNITEKYHHDNFFWNQIVDHPNYDTFWQKRNILPHLKNIKPAVLTVGGWFDAEDLYGPLNIYKTIEKSTPGAKNTIVMGPWAHGGWAGESGKTTHNHIYFGDSISHFPAEY
jgi:hypothetical protein